LCRRILADQWCYIPINWFVSRRRCW
jgi:hypothetical protein